MSDDRSHDLIAAKNEVRGEKSEIHLKVEEYIGQRYQVHLTDGRMIEGVMIATDKDANMIFNKAEERWENNPKQKPRFLGQAMIAKTHVKSMNKSPKTSL